MPSERFFRHRSNGYRGKMVHRRGSHNDIVIEYAYGNERRQVPYLAHEWLEERERPVMTKAQIAHVAQAADGALCKYIGFAGVPREWLMMNPQQKIEFIAEGPDTDDVMRRAIYIAIVEVLSHAGR